MKSALSTLKSLQLLLKRLRHVEDIDSHPKNDDGEWFEGVGRHEMSHVCPIGKFYHLFCVLFFPEIERKIRDRDR